MPDLIVRIKKKTNGEAALTCQRADGSITWQRQEGQASRFFPMHDLTHFAVESILGPNLLCWTTNFFIKEPKSPGFVSWHQDAFYWGLSKDDVVTAWVALSPANLESGCMKFVPGSQTQDHLQHVDTFHKDNLLSRGQDAGWPF